MKDTLLFLVTAIVDHPDDVVIDEQVTEGHTVYVVHVHQEDMGKIIGKQGRIIRALRDLIKLMAAKQNQYVDIELAEDERPAAEPATE